MHIGNASITVQELLAIGVAAVFAITFEIVRKRTLLGKLGMAIALDPEMASAVGANTKMFVNQSVEENLVLGALHLRRDHKRVAELLESVYELFPVVGEYRDRPCVLAGGEVALEEAADAVDVRGRALINAYLG